MSKLSFEQRAIAAVKGPNAEETANKIKRKANAALTAQIALQKAKIVDLEDAVTEAKEKVDLATVNSGKPIKDNDDYIGELFLSRSAVTAAEEALEVCKSKIEFLSGVLAEVEEAEKK